MRLLSLLALQTIVSVGDPDVEDAGGHEITVTLDVVNNNGTIQIDENDEDLISSGSNNSELLTSRVIPLP